MSNAQHFLLRDVTMRRLIHIEFKPAPAPLLWLLSGGTPLKGTYIHPLTGEVQTLWLLGKGKLKGDGAEYMRIAGGPFNTRCAAIEWNNQQVSRAVGAA